MFWSAVVMLGMSGFFAGLSILWGLARASDIFIFRAPIEVSLKAGYLWIKMDYCKPKYTRPADVRLEFDDTTRDFQALIPETFVSELPVGCHDYTDYIPIPPILPPGTYRVRMIRSYRINPFKTITVESVSNAIMVSEPKTQ